MSCAVLPRSAAPAKPLRHRTVRQDEALFPPTHQVVVRRRNGRFLKSVPAWSKYAAKQARDQLEAKYDAGYYVEIEPA